MGADGWRGKVGALARDEVDEFLAEGRIARLGCLDAEGWPYVVPVWHEWDGSAFWVVARRRSIWATYLAADGRCSLAIDEDGRQRKVLAQCRAEVVEEPCLDGRWVPVAERMSVRYLGENGPKYLVPTLDKPRWLIRLDPVRMQTWQGNDWAARYK
jgi:nitroimidazol reductase NimA-like FMN-containing flavoprotein (pyridoxamine 5'-phosphate oxidase superfamily)